MSHEKQGISRNPMEGRCGSAFLKRRNKKTIWKANQASAGPEVAAGWASARSPTAATGLISLQAGLLQMCPARQYSHRVPGKSTFLLLGSTSPGAYNEGGPSSRFSPWAKPASETWVRTQVSHPVPQVDSPSAPAASSTSRSFGVLLPFNRAHGPSYDCPPSYRFQVQTQTDERWDRRGQDKVRTQGCTPWLGTLTFQLPWGIGFILSSLNMVGRDDKQHLLARLAHKMKCV